MRRPTKALHHYEDSQSQTSDAEVTTTAIVAALHFQGNFELACHSPRKRQSSKDVREKSLQSSRTSNPRLVSHFVSGCGLPFSTFRDIS